MALTVNLKRTGASGAKQAREDRQEKLEAILSAPLTPIEQQIREKISFLRKEMNDSDYVEFYKKTPMLDHLLLPVLNQKIFELEVEAIRAKSLKFLPVLPDTITLETRTPPAPNNFYTALCICFDDGQFIAEFPNQKDKSFNFILDVLGFFYDGRRGGVYHYKRRPSWETRKIDHKNYEVTETEEPLF